MSEQNEKKPRRSRLSRFINLFIIAAVAGLWLCRERFELDESLLFVLTGIALMIILLSIGNRRKQLDNFETARALKHMREEMDKPHFFDE